jgi:hypothetical protein
MNILKTMSKTGFMEMVLLGILLAAAVFGLGDALTRNPDRVEKVFGLLIGILLARGLAGLWQVYRTTNS